MHVSSVDYQRQLGKYQDAALSEPVIITNRGRERLVLLSVDEYQRLKRRDRQVLASHELSDDDLEQITNSVAPAEAAEYNSEYKG